MDINSDYLDTETGQVISPDLVGEVEWGIVWRISEEALRLQADQLYVDVVRALCELSSVSVVVKYKPHQVFSVLHLKQTRRSQGKMRGR